MNIFCTSLMHKGGDRRKRIKEESESSDTYYHHKRDITEPAARSLYSYTQDSKPEG